MEWIPEFISFLGYYIGEIFLYLITFGRRKILWDPFEDPSHKERISLSRAIGIIVILMAAIPVLMAYCGD
jgi:hypothetical protein